MHELGIVFHIISGVEKAAEENHLKEIDSVTVELGQVSTVIPDYLSNCWKWAAKKSDMLKDTKLIMEEIPAVTYCKNCNKTYDTVEYGKTCPHCGSGRTYLLQGNEINIREITAC